jgi:hypothetical protein
MRMIRPKAARLQLDPLSCESLGSQILRRDGWRRQSCGTMLNLKVHHREFGSHSEADSVENHLHYVWGPWTEINYFPSQECDF